MTENSQEAYQRYSWHNNIGNVYQEIINRLHELWLERSWLGDHIRTNSLRNAARDGNPDVTIQPPAPDSIGGQFYVYMPSHSYKVEFTLDQLLENECLLPITTENSYLAIVDIGCGGGAASTAVINSILKKQKGKMNVLFTGVEVDEHAIQLYNWVMLKYENISSLSIQIKSRAIFKGIPEALTYIAEGLQQARLDWQVPYLSDLWVIQANVVRPLANQHERDIATRNKLELSKERGLIPDDFGIVLARSYQHLLQLTQADRMLMLTIATTDSADRNGTRREQEQRNRAAALTDAIQKTFTEKQHNVQCTIPIQSTDSPLSVEHENPIGSYWREIRELQSNSAKFYATVLQVENRDFLNDIDWQRIISLDNLKLAWVRVQAAMRRDSITDEIGLILFDKNVQSHLEELRNLLLTYTVQISDYPRFFYEIPKNSKESRIKGIQSIEEEILAVAMIQILGEKTISLMVRNYGYRLNLGSNSEFLYRPWFRSYRKYTDTIRRSIKGQDDDVLVIRTDVEKFFNNIPQEMLFQSTLKHFHGEQNPRIIWLLQQLIVSSIEHHQLGKGIMQGPTVSGYLANLYLLAVDQSFSDERDDGALFLRYVDDIVVIVPNPRHRDKIKKDLATQLGKLNLEISNEKTDELSKTSGLREFIRYPDLDQFDKEFKILTGGLYFGNRLYQDIIRDINNRDWWAWIYQYQMCLRSIGIFIEGTRLSRKVWQYVNGAVPPINRRLIPSFDLTTNPELWGEEYKIVNPNWLNKYLSLRKKLSNSLKKAWNKWNLIQDDDTEELQKRIAERKKIQTRITFILNRLAILGFDDVLLEIVEMFRDDPHVIKAHRLILDHIALQQQIETFRTLWDYLSNASFPGANYVRAMYMRAIRYFNVIQANELGLLINCALYKMDAVELLMATETLLIGDHRPSVSESRLLLAKSIEFENVEPRIARNLIMLAGQSQFRYDSIEVSEFLKYAYDSGESQILASYREEPEQEDIRRTYYHSRYPDGPDEFEGDYF